jgi:hypothetical protein
MKGNRIDQTETNIPKKITILSQKYFLKAATNLDTSL